MGLGSALGTYLLRTGTLSWVTVCLPALLLSPFGTHLAHGDAKHQRTCCGTAGTLQGGSAVAPDPRDEEQGQAASHVQVQRHYYMCCCPVAYFRLPASAQSLPQQ